MSVPEAQQSWQRRNLKALAIGLLTALVICLIYLVEDVTNLGLLHNTEARLVDLRFRLRGPTPPSGEVVVVAIDSKSVEAIGRWPWPRTIHARLVDRLRELGASTVAFDVLFTERQGEREARRLRAIEEALPPDADAARAEVAKALEDVLIDQHFAAAMERAIDADAAWTVLGFDFVLPEDVGENSQLGKLLGDDEEQVILDIASYASRDENVAYLRREPPKLALGIRPVITELMDWSAALGYVNPVLDTDGALRRERLLVVYCREVRQAWLEKRFLAEVLEDPQQRVQAIMPLAVAAVATHLRLTVDQLTLDLEAGELRFPMGEGGEERKIRFDPGDGTMMINYHGAGRTIPTYSIVDVLDGSLPDPEALRGKLVLVGLSDPGLGDTFTTPFTARLPGVEKHATTADNLLTGDQLLTHRDADLMILLTAFLAAVFSALLAANLQGWRAPLAGAALLVGFLAVTYRDFTAGFLWNWTMPVLSMLLSGGLVTLFQAIRDRRLRQQMEERSEFLQHTFGRYLSDEVVAMLVDSPEGLKLGGEKKELTILMSDLRGFTAMCERSTPEVVIRMLNVYLGKMADLVLKYQGTVDEFIGDAVLALFGAPVAREGDAERAVACALEMQVALLEVNEFFRSQGLPEVEMGVALNTGDVIVGNIGSERRSKYGVVGSNVNLTARIESYTVGGQVLISGATLEQAGGIVRVGDRVDVAAKGLKDPVPAYQALSIGEPYNVKLPEIREEFFDLREPVRVTWVALSGKKVGDDYRPGRFTRLSNLGADMASEETFAPLVNLKMTVLDDDGQQLDGDLYAKVIQREVEDGLCPLRFTSVPPTVKKYFKKVRGRQDADRPESRRAGTLEVPKDLARQIVEQGMEKAPEG